MKGGGQVQGVHVQSSKSFHLMSTSACDVDEKVVVVVVVEGRTEGVCFMLFHHVCHHACSILQIDLVESGPIFGSHIGTYPTSRYAKIG